MSRVGGSANGTQQEPSYFEQQRETLLQDIFVNMEHVLQNINKLNRSLEGVIAVGNEFSQVEGLWSQFENVMAKGSDGNKDDAAETGVSERDSESGQ
ncbi:Dolichyl-diphosphooligosaccharide-protein glycosyltransferase subunit dad1 [Taxawa tesnikishii (nom. ined.)]|nr:Dolichyl-diphosphooligosaccharide-protein glycosyltransferase subunit dad1 [Dothideales sp. JES 119]